MSNNALHNRDCPALMSDGRMARDHRPSAYVHDLMIKQNGLKNSHQLRMFLQRNANQLRELNLDFFHQQYACNSCEPFHVDPNGHDAYWAAYKEDLHNRQ